MVLTVLIIRGLLNAYVHTMEDKGERDKKRG